MCGEGGDRRVVAWGGGRTGTPGASPLRGEAGRALWLPAALLACCSPTMQKAFAGGGRSGGKAWNRLCTPPPRMHAAPPLSLPPLPVLHDRYADHEAREGSAVVPGFVPLPEAQLRYARGAGGGGQGSLLLVLLSSWHARLPLDLAVLLYSSAAPAYNTQ